MGIYQCVSGRFETKQGIDYCSMEKSVKNQTYCRYIANISDTKRYIKFIAIYLGYCWVCQDTKNSNKNY